MSRALFLAALIVILFSAVVVCAQEGSYEKGLQAYLKKDYGAAVKYLKEYVAAKPDAKGYYLLGYASYESKRRSGHKQGRRDFWGDTETAKYFREAYRIDPDFSPRTAIFKK